MYTLDTAFSEIIKVAGVEDFLKKVAPTMLAEPTCNYIAALKLSQLSAMQPGADKIVEAIVAIANGETPSFEATDPKLQKPKISGSLGFGGLYNPNEVDGPLYMLDHRFSGCVVVKFDKMLDESIAGEITYNGKPVPYTLTQISVAGNSQMIGAFVRDIATEYDTEYSLDFKGFTDVDANEMEPATYTFKTATKNAPDPKYADNEMVAQNAAQEGMVLLKNNDNFLPFCKNKSFALIGGADFRIGAVGAGKINPRYAVRFEEAVKNSSFIVDDLADTAIIVISRASGENFDNGAFEGQYYLTKDEENTIELAKQKYRSIVAIINSGYPMDIRWTQSPQVKSIIWTGYAGMLAGTALVNILNGTVNPSGHLVDTWCNDYYDDPSSKNFFMPETASGALDADQNVWVNTVYEEDIYVGYRFFETFNRPVAYCFGHGLSYTSFNIDASQVDDLTIKVAITNTGDVCGQQVAQVYANIQDNKLEQPSMRLVGFHKTKLLKPSETETATITIPKSVLTSFDEDCCAYIMEEGLYSFYVGSSVKNVCMVGSFTMDKTEIVKQVDNYMEPPIKFTRLSKRDVEATMPTGHLSGIIEGATCLHNSSPRQNVDDVEVIDNTFVENWCDEELARFSVCASSGWGMQDTGVAGRVYRLENRDIPKYEVADGNNGVNINTPNIGMPTSNLVCSTWNPEIAYKIGEIIAKEAKEHDVSMILAPAMNIHRNPLNGRHAEYFSEDPFLTGIMAGNQSKGLEENGVASSIKHVCCNNSEATRKRNHSIVSQRALREIYLKAFEIAIEVHNPESIMTAYNACNGCFTAEDEELIQGIFRKEFGFKGFVMTDWNSYDTADVAKCVQAGNCWLTPGTMNSKHTDKIIKGLSDGTIKRERLMQNVKYMYRSITKNSK